MPSIGLKPHERERRRKGRERKRQKTGHTRNANVGD